MRRPPHRTTALATLLWIPCLSGCAARSAADEQQPHPLVGTWHLATTSPSERPNPGMRLTLAVDSAGATTFHGRIASFFSGNVGIDPRNYRPFVGEISPADSTVRLLIEPAEQRAQPIQIEGTLAGDSIAVTTLTIGRDTLRAAWPLLFVRER